MSLRSAPHCAFRRPTPRVYDLVLQARGRSPNGKKIAVGTAGVTATDRVIPSVAYTDPEVAWVGLTEDSGLVRKASRYGGACFPGMLPAAPSPMAATKASPSCCLTIHPKQGQETAMLAGATARSWAAAWSVPTPVT